MRLSVPVSGSKQMTANYERPLILSFDLDVLGFSGELVLLEVNSGNNAFSF
jgi:hypothetical protein